MKEKESSVFGLLGKNISYSFSRGFFTDKFKALNFKKNKYVNFDIQQIEDFPSIINKEQNLKGLNVTIPYKEEVIKYLDKLDFKDSKKRAINLLQEVGIKDAENRIDKTAVPYLKKQGIDVSKLK